MDKVRVTEITESLNGKVSDTTLEKLIAAGIESNSLPKVGKFASFVVSGSEPKSEDDPDYRHVRMCVAGSDDTISISCLKVLAPLISTEPTFGEIKREGSKLKGKKYLKGVALNPSFAKYSQVELIALLENRSFKAAKVDYYSLPYAKEGWENPKKDDLLVKTGYIVTLTD